MDYDQPVRETVESPTENDLPIPPAGVHPVVDILRGRLVSGSRPGNRQDPYRVALAIEGGSMRSVVSAGMASGLAQLGLRDTFDDVFGSSAGALIGAYFIAGQGAIAPSIYFQDLSNKHFADIRRLLRRRPVMNLDFLFDVIERTKPLDWQAVINSPIRFHSLATSLATGDIVDFTNIDTEERLRAVLRASSVLPVIAGDPFVIDGTGYLDAGLRESFPYRSALRDGCTHVVVLRTRATGGVPSPVSAAQRLVAGRLLGADKQILDLVDARPQRYAAEEEEMFRLRDSSDANTGVFVIEPRDAGSGIDRLSLNRPLIEAAARGGIEATYAALSLPQPQVFEVLQAYPPTKRRAP
jgi:predicted patatin/cPLA2 family phospholipase